MNVVILGLGNILLTDEGVGVRIAEMAAERLALPPGVEVVDGGTTGMDLLDTLADRDHVIVTDAVKTGAPPGTVVRLTGDQVPAFFRQRMSPHQLALSDVLATLKLAEAAPKTVTVIGVVPRNLSLGLELTPETAEAAEKALDLLRDELASLGVLPQAA
jgi:hydrogenase maturation protease